MDVDAIAERMDPKKLHALSSGHVVSKCRFKNPDPDPGPQARGMDVDAILRRMEMAEMVENIHEDVKDQSPLLRVHAVLRSCGIEPSAALDWVLRDADELLVLPANASPLPCSFQTV